MQSQFSVTVDFLLSFRCLIYVVVNLVSYCTVLLISICDVEINNTVQKQTKFTTSFPVTITVYPSPAIGSPNTAEMLYVMSFSH